MTTFRTLYYYHYLDQKRVPDADELYSLNKRLNTVCIYLNNKIICKLRIKLNLSRLFKGKYPFIFKPINETLEFKYDHCGVKCNDKVIIQACDDFQGVELFTDLNKCGEGIEFDTSGALLKPVNSTYFKFNLLSNLNNHNLLIIYISICIYFLVQSEDIRLRCSNTLINKKRSVPFIFEPDSID